MEKPIQWMFGLGVVCWMIWILLASDPHGRIGRTCSPVAWTGTVSVSIMRILIPGTERTVASAMDKADFGCQQVVWNLFYGAEYNEAKRKQVQGMIGQ